MNGPQRVIGTIAILFLLLLVAFPPVAFRLPGHPDVVTGYGFAPAWQLPEQSRIDWVLFAAAVGIDLIMCGSIAIAIHPRRGARRKQSLT